MRTHSFFAAGMLMLINLGRWLHPRIDGWTWRFSSISQSPFIASPRSMVDTGLGKGWACVLVLLILFVSSGVSAAPPTGSGQRVIANATVNVRASAGSSSILGTQPNGAAGTTISGPVVATLSGTSYTWFNVNFDSGTDGWVASIGLDRAYSVTPSAGTGGSVSPATTQTVKGGGARSFTVSPNSGYTRNPTVGGTCPLGSWSGNTWTTGAINANCTVSFSFLALLSAPSLSSPASGATGISTTPTFSWSSVTGANRYWLTVATSSSALPTNPSATTCPSCVITGSTGGTSHTLPATFSYPYPGTSVALSPGTTYYWRVQGWNSNGAQGNFAPIRSFTTASKTTYTLSVNSSGVSGVAITSSTGHGGTTNYTKTGLASGTSVTLTAPTASGGASFSSWTGCNSTSGATCTLSMTASKTVTAAYAAPSTYTLSVNSSGVSGVAITSSTGHGGTTNYTKTGLAPNTSVTLTAPATSGGASFGGWSGCNSTSGTSGVTCTVSMTANKPVTAAYAAPSYTLTVNSSGVSGVAITSSTGHGGTTNYTKTGLAPNTSVTLTAPTTSGGASFSSWTGCNSASGATCMVSMTANKTVTAAYAVPSIGGFVWPLSNPTITQIYACRYNDAGSCADLALKSERYKNGINVHTGVDMQGPFPAPTGTNQKIVAKGDNVNVRASAASTTILGTQPFGAPGTTTSGPVSAALDGRLYDWWFVNFDSGQDGWVAGDVIGQEYGVSVKAAATGIVHAKIDYGVSHGMGKVVILRHGTATPHKYTLYGHLDSFDSCPAVGQAVSQGAELGKMGRSTTTLRDSSMGVHLHFEIKDNGALGNISNDGDYWGYTPGHPDLYGYHDPRTLINGIAIEAIAPIAYRNSVAASVDMRAIPGTSYPYYSGNANELVIGKLGAGQKVVATKRASVDGVWWYFVDLPSRNTVYNGKHGGWISGSYLAQELSAEQRQVALSGDGYAVRSNPGTATTLLARVYARQRFVSAGSAVTNPDTACAGLSWVPIYVPATNASTSTAQTGWVCNAAFDPVGTYTLTVNSSGVSGVAITSSTGHGGTTNYYPRTGLASGTNVTLTAPTTSGGASFSSWLGCNSASGATCTVSMTASKTVTAVYAAPSTYTLSVNSTGVSGVAITSSTGHGGTTNYPRTGLASGTNVTLTAPTTSGGASFSGWSGCNSISGTICTVSMTANKSVTAIYTTSTSFTLSVNSTGVGGVAITSSTGHGGTTNYLKNGLASGMNVILTAPATSRGANFSGWTGCNSTSGATCTVSMTANKTVTAAYAVTSDIIFQPGPDVGVDAYITNIYQNGYESYKEYIRIGGWGDYYYGLIRFALDGLPAYAQRVIIRLHLAPSTSPTLPMYLDRVTSYWDETVRWESQPSYSYLRLLSAPTKNQPYDVDVTDLYNAWKSGSMPNHGVQLRTTRIPSNEWSTFYSSDYLADPSLRPALIVTP